MLPSEELLQSIDILAQNAVKDSVKIYTAIVTSVGDNNTCSVRVNGKTHSNIVYYGDAPTVNKSYRVFCPNGSMNQAFIITGGGSSGTEAGTTDYNKLTNRPSINGNVLSGNQTSEQLGITDDKTFTFNQAVASTEWQINHGLNKYPSVTIVDSGNNIVIGDIEYIDKNNVKCTFSSAFSGSAYLN